MDGIVHFEIPATNLKRAKQFYEKAFKWKLADYGKDYVLATTTPTGKKGPTKPGAINGGLIKRNPVQKTPLVVVDVKDIASSLRTIKRLGGKLLKDKVPVGEMGYAAYFKDPEGNVVGLWQTKRK